MAPDHVGGFQVAVNHPGFVCVGEGPEELLHDRERVRHLHRAFFDELLEFAALNELQDEEGKLAETKVDDRHNIRMTQGGEGLCFA